MNIEKGVQRLVDKTIEDILNDKYKLIKIGEYESSIKYKENVLRVWVANGASCCNISSIKGFSFPDLSEEVKAKLFSIATTITPQYLKLQLKEARKTQKEAYLKYKDSVRATNEIRAKIKELK